MLLSTGLCLHSVRPSRRRAKRVTGLCRSVEVKGNKQRKTQDAYIVRRSSFSQSYVVRDTGSTVSYALPVAYRCSTKLACKVNHVSTICSLPAYTRVSCTMYTGRMYSREKRWNKYTINRKTRAYHSRFTLTDRVSQIYTKHGHASIQEICTQILVTSGLHSRLTKLKSGNSEFAIILEI